MIQMFKVPLIVTALMFPLSIGATEYHITPGVDAIAVDGVCSLREALQASNTHTAVNECPAGGKKTDILHIAPGYYPLDCTLGRLVILRGMSLLGTDVAMTTIDGLNQCALFDIDNPTNRRVLIEGISLIGGNAVAEFTSQNGGAIAHINGFLAIRKVFCYNNQALLGGCYAKEVDFGDTDVYFEDVVIVNNTAGFGGGIYSQSNTRIHRTAIVGNQGTVDFGNASVGGGLYQFSGRLILEDVTIADNNAPDTTGLDCFHGEDLVVREKRKSPNILGVGCVKDNRQ